MPGIEELGMRFRNVEKTVLWDAMLVAPNVRRLTLGADGIASETIPVAARVDRLAHLAALTLQGPGVRSLLDNTRPTVPQLPILINLDIDTSAFPNSALVREDLARNLISLTLRGAGSLGTFIPTFSSFRALEHVTFDGLSEVPAGAKHP